jgi:hypothetical protein
MRFQLAVQGGKEPILSIKTYCRFGGSWFLEHINGFSGLGHVGISDWEYFIKIIFNRILY